MTTEEKEQQLEDLKEIQRILNTKLPAGGHAEIERALTIVAACILKQEKP